MTECRTCTRATQDAAALCQWCGDQIGQILTGELVTVFEMPGGIVDLAAELETAMTRQASHGDRVGGRSATVPLPFEPRAADVLNELRTFLVGWVRLLNGDNDDWPADNVPSMAGWLCDRLDLIRRHEAADELHYELTAEAGLVKQSWLAVDRPPEVWFAGLCACGARLYAKPDARRIRCRGCGSTWNIQQRREWLIKASKDYLLTATEASDALAAWGQKVTPARIRKWAERRRITARGSVIGLNGNTAPTYRLGDIIDLLAAEARRANEKKSAS